MSDITTDFSGNSGLDGLDGLDGLSGYSGFSGNSGNLVVKPSGIQSLSWGQFLCLLSRKMMTNFVSAKLWAFWGFFVVSGIFLRFNFISGDTWSYTNLSALGLVFGMREFSKANKNSTGQSEEEKSVNI